jgi:hypothetical protein
MGTTNNVPQALMNEHDVGTYYEPVRGLRQAVAASPPGTYVHQKPSGAPSLEARASLTALIGSVDFYSHCVADRAYPTG